MQAEMIDEEIQRREKIIARACGEIAELEDVARPAVFVLPLTPAQAAALLVAEPLRTEQEVSFAAEAAKTIKAALSLYAKELGRR